MKYLVVLLVIVLSSCGSTYVERVYSVVYQNGELDTITVEGINHTYAKLYSDGSVDIVVEGHTQYKICGVRELALISENIKQLE